MTERHDLEALILTLSHGLQPVRRLWAPWARTLGFLLFCLAVAGCLLLWAGPDTLSRRLTHEPFEALSMLAAFVTAALAAGAAFQLALPGRSVRVALLPLPAVIVWMGSSSYSCEDVGFTIGDVGQARTCFRFILSVSVPLSLALYVMLRRAYPVRPALIAAMAGLAASAAAAALLEIVHPIGVTPMDLAAHAAAIGTVVLINRLVSAPALQRWALVLLLALPFQGVRAQGTQTRPIVLELYTSQGCSSCPPADALLTQLRDRADVLPLAFHVDYWNRLGWVDPFSSAAYTQRERLHSARLGEDTIYTPELVVDGAQAVVGSDRAAVDNAMRAARGRVVTAASVSAARSANGDLAITVGPGAGTARVLIVGFDRSHTTPIGRGENNGRTLQESNVVRSLQVASEWRGQPLALRQPWPAGERVAVLLEGGDGRIIGAAATP